MNSMPHLMHRPRPTTATIGKTIPVVVISPSESLQVVTSNGQPLLEISYGAAGPSIRLAQDCLQLECQGDLDLNAKSITLRASEDVTIQGKTIRLN